MPRFDTVLSTYAKSAIAIVKAGEIARVSLDGTTRGAWTITKIEALYELAYLRVFAAWETCLESIFYRSLCGFSFKVGQETLIRGSHFSTIGVAETAVLAGNQYVLWHNPQKVIDRCKRFIRSGAGFPAVQENVISSNLAYLQNLSYVRHRIVHDQTDAKNKFNSATLTIAATVYPASRPGKFLRDWDRSKTPNRRWLEVAVSDLVSLATQMV